MLKLTIRRACRNSAGGQHKRGKFVSSVNQFSLAPDATNWRVSSAWRSCNLSSLPLAERQHKCGVGSTRRTGGRIDRRQSSAVTGRSEACMHRHADRGGGEERYRISSPDRHGPRVLCSAGIVHASGLGKQRRTRSFVLHGNGRMEPNILAPSCDTPCGPPRRRRSLPPCAEHRNICRNDRSCFRNNTHLSV
jgi:hypothetical protein